MKKYQAEANRIAETLRNVYYDFLDSPEWKSLRRKVIIRYGRKCMKCKTTPKDPKRTHVDHIKPRRYFPELALEFDNLQVLCCRCNRFKGNKVADYR
jgi:5-methylcytosine-specific restriction endonuclease McrA